MAIVVVWLGWRYWSLCVQIDTAGFVSHQAVKLREAIKYASQDTAHSKNGGALINRNIVLYSLNWYIGCFDDNTNTLEHSAVLGFVTIERDYVVRDAIAYLRKTGTNDYGDDPHEWLKHEYSN